MASFGSAIRKRVKDLERLYGQGRVERIIDRVAELATEEAVTRAQELTPPNGNAKLAGTNMRSGEMAQAWLTDSVTKPKRGRTELNNFKQYASYVNDGHRVDRHFVPGLIINGDMLERSPDPSTGGIVVGTKTQYVEGLYMKEAAIGRYRRTVRKTLDRLITEELKPNDLYT